MPLTQEQGIALLQPQFPPEGLDRLFADIAIAHHQLGWADQVLPGGGDGLLKGGYAGGVQQDGLGTTHQGVEFVGVFGLGGEGQDIIPPQAVDNYLRCP